MPNFDKTGPAGQGPRTGRGQGTCVLEGGNPQSGFGQGFGCCARGMRRGMRRGMGNFLGQGNAPLSLEEQEKVLEERLQAIGEAKKNGKMKK